MATIQEMIENGELTKINPGLGDEELEWRCIYGTDDFIEWLENDLPNLVHNTTYADLSPFEQVATIFSEYIVGENFSDDRRFKKLRKTPSPHIWELKTDDVRIFGWVPHKDQFICVYDDEATKIKALNTYGWYMQKTKNVMDSSNLDDPKCITGEKYNDVISAKN